MAKKKEKVTSSEVVVAKSQVVAKPKKERRLAWGGSIPSVGAKEENFAVLQKFCNQVAQIYGVPSMGVNAMGGQPYLNKDGRLFLLHDLRKGKAGLQAIRKEFLQMSTNIDQASIIKVTLVFKDGHEVEAIGEASKESVKLTAVKQTLNMMAETRGLNRAIWQEISGDVWNRISKNVTGSKLNDEEKSRVMEAGRSSYEEMANPEAEREANENKIRSFVSTCNNVDKLLAFNENLQSSELYTDEFKNEIGQVISGRVDSLTNA